MSEVVTIAGIAAGGDGVGRLADGRAVFVPRTAPGDRVALRQGVKLHKTFARGDVAAVVTPGPGRVTPPCPHFTRDHCGGCQLQQLAYDAQLEAKRALVGDALRRIGKLDCADPEIVEAIEEWRYRAKITLAVKRAGGRADAAVVGLHPYGHPGVVFPLADCHITDFRLMALWRELKQHLGLLPPHVSHVTGAFHSLARPRDDHATTARPQGPGGRTCSPRKRTSGDRPHVLGLIALGAAGHFELDPLPFLEAPVTGALDRRVVHELVGTTFAGDEAVTLLRVEPFHCASRQDRLLPSVLQEGPA